MNNGNEMNRFNGPNCKEIYNNYDKIEMNRIDLDEEMENFVKQCAKFFGSACVMAIVMALLAMVCIAEGN